MRDQGLNYIGKITINSLRHYILDSGLSGSDVILLHQFDFDEIALEYKETYNSSLPIPFVELGILVDEDTTSLVSKGRIKVLRDVNLLNNYYASADEFSSTDDIIYRCGWCGNVVDFDGAEFDTQTRMHKISILEKYKHKIFVKHVHGECCPNGDA